MSALIEKDPVTALCRLIKEAGLTMTLYGVPVSEKELRSQASASSDERIERVVCSSIKDQMTDAEKLKLLLDKCEEIIPYVLATLPYESQKLTKHNVTCDDKDYVAIHGGRAISSTRQLANLLKLVEELKK